MPTKPRIAIVFDNTLRPDTTGTHCLHALKEMAEVIHILPADLMSDHHYNADLFLRVDDGINYPIPKIFRPSAYWCIDTHINYATRLIEARSFDKVFCAQKDGAEQMRQDGVDAQWLPLACNPVLHGRQDVPKEFDICMIGRIMYAHPRSDLLALLQAYYPKTFAGVRSYEELGLAYSSARLAFNRSVGGDLNMRVFEALCSGTPLLTDVPVTGLTELFQPNQHLITYTSPEELLDRADYYLRHEQEAARIGEEGRQEVLAKHTYMHRMHNILTAFNITTVKKNRSRTLPTPRHLAHKDSFISPEVVTYPVIFRTSETGSDAAHRYYDYPRPEVLARIPEQAHTILDIGCAAGWLGAELKRRAEQAGRKPPTVIGVEINPSVATRASEKLDAVIVGDIEELLQENPSQLLMSLQTALASSGSHTAVKSRKGTRKNVSEQKLNSFADLQAGHHGLYDCIVLADVLEHLRNPEQVLNSLRALLAEEGTLVLSVPNVGHADILKGLAHGRWTYRDEGLLDRTHLRFFTRRDLEQTLFRVGFTVTDIGWVASPGYHDWIQMGRPSTLKFNNITLVDVENIDAESFFAIQWLVTARKRPQRDFGLTSIVILTKNQLSYTRACVESIRAHTSEPYELIFVDNGSSDDTLLYLKTLSNITVIQNKTNQGFPKGCNQGIAEASGANILLLNNDTLVTKGWLTRLLEALYSADDVGAVGPRSHGTIGTQKCYGPPPEIAKVDDYGWDMARVYEGCRVPVFLLIGFCFLARKSALDVVGPLDERFGIGFFEDNDLSNRFLEAGFRLLCAADAYVYHHVSTTFKGEKINIPSQFGLAEQLYRAKWGDDSTLAARLETGSKDRTCITLPPLPQNPQISACVFAHGDAGTLRDCLDCLRTAVDEIILLDSGNQDEIDLIAEEYGTLVLNTSDEHPLFEARAKAVTQASGDWMLWMDANERILPEYLSTLQELAHTNNPRLAGYIFACRYIDAIGDYGIPRCYQVRMMRRHETIPSHFRSELEILPTLKRAGFDMVTTTIEVLHAGEHRNSPQVNEQQLQQRRQALERYPNDPFLLYELGNALNMLQCWREAVPVLQQAIGLFAYDNPTLPKTIVELVQAYQHLYGSSVALQVAFKGLNSWPQDPELLFHTAQLLYHIGRPHEACFYYERILSDTPRRYCVEIGEGILSYQTRYGWGLALYATGHPDEAERLVRASLQDNPRFLPAWLFLAELLLSKADITNTWEVLNRILEIEPQHPDALALRGKIHMERSEMVDARRDLARSVVSHPNNPKARRILADLLLRIGQFAEAERELSAVIEQDPRDAGSLTRLATLMARSQRAHRAIDLYQRALALRPDEPNILFGLAMALKDTGNTVAAADHFRQIVQRFPDHEQALYEWGEAAYALGDHEHARSCFQRVIQRNPGHMAAKSAMAALGATQEIRR